MHFSLRDKCQRRIFKMLDDARGEKNSQPCVLIVDSHTVEILSSCSKHSDLLGRGVANVSLIRKSRQPLPQFRVLYFILPTTENVRLIIKDQVDGIYKESVIYFTTPSMVTVRTMLQQLPRGLLKSCEMYMDFLVTDSHAFHLGMGDIVKSLFPWYQKAIIIQRISAKIVTLLVSIGDNPYIRYWNPGLIENSDGLAYRSANCKSVASTIRQYLNDYYSGEHIVNRKVTRSIFLTLDRRIDLGAPLLHQWSYESLLYDHLDGDVTSGVIFSDEKGKEKQRLILNEEDEIFAKVRSKHITEAQKTVFAELKHFASTHVAAKVSKTKRSDIKISDLREAVGDLPKYGQLCDSFGKHTRLIERVLQIAGEELLEVSEIEQEIFLLRDAAGDDISPGHAAETLYEKLSTVPAKYRLRLVCLALSCFRKIPVKLQELMLGHGLLSAEDHRALSGFVQCRLYQEPSGLLYSIIDDKKTIKLKWKKRPDGFDQVEHRAGKLDLSRYSHRAKTFESRANIYEPGIVHIARKLVEGALDTNMFPCLNPQDDSEATRTVRSKNFGGNTAATMASKWQWGTVSKRPRVILYVVGGVTRGEIAAVNALSSELEVDIILGGDTIWTAQSFLDALAKGEESDT